MKKGDRDQQERRRAEETGSVLDTMQRGGSPAEATMADVDNEDEGPEDVSGARAERLIPSAEGSTERVEGDEVESRDLVKACNVSPVEKSTAVGVRHPQYEVQYGLLKDGVLSPKVLEKIGMVLRDESSREDLDGKPPADATMAGVESVDDSLRQGNEGAEGVSGAHAEGPIPSVEGSTEVVSRELRHFCSVSPVDGSTAMAGVENLDEGSSREDLDGEQPADATMADVENVDSLRQGNKDEWAEGVSGALAECLIPSAEGSTEVESRYLLKVCSVSPVEESTAMAAVENVDEGPEGVSGALADGLILSAEGSKEVESRYLLKVCSVSPVEESTAMAAVENVDEGADGVSGALAEGLIPSTEGSQEVESRDLLKVCSLSPLEQSTAVVVRPPEYAVQYAEGGGLLKDGVLSFNGLAKMGIVLRDESSSEEESESSSDSSSEEDDSDADESSDDSSEEEEDDMKDIKEKIRRSSDETKEDTEPPRTKNEVSVLPPVPRVETVLKPHHVCVSTGVISSVVERYIVVEGKDDSKVLTDGSILWLTESRLPLGIVDEVFGPVKKPYYSLRFNKVSDIHESAKVGADVSYVAEFAEFVLKDNPTLYKKAIDASGLDDEELSDAEIEFSDDEKEMAAKQRERGKRGSDSKENGGQVWDSSVSHSPEARSRWQKRERGRGLGYSRGGPNMPEGVAAMADMDLHGPGFSAGMSQRGPGRARPDAGRSKFQSNPRQSNSGGWDGQDVGATYSRLHDGRSRGDWAPSPTRHSPGAGPSANGAYHQIPTLRRDERRDGPWYSEQVDVPNRQPHQAVGGQGLPSFGVAPLHRHLQVPGPDSRQQVGSGYSAFGYSSVAGPQIATDGQGNFFHITGPVNLPPDAGNVGRMGMNVGPTLVSVLPPTSPNSYSLYNSPDPVYQADLSHRGQHGGFMGPSPGYSNRIAAPEFRFQGMPSNSLSSMAAPEFRFQGMPSNSPSSMSAPEFRFQGMPSNSPSSMSAPEFRFQAMPSNSPSSVAALEFRFQGMPSNSPSSVAAPEFRFQGMPSNSPSSMSAPEFRFQAMPSNSPSSVAALEFRFQGMPSNSPSSMSAPEFRFQAMPSNSPSSVAAPDFRFQAMPSNSPISVPGRAGGPHGSGYARGSPPHAHRQRYQGSRGR